VACLLGSRNEQHLEAICLSLLYLPVLACFWLLRWKALIWPSCPSFSNRTWSKRQQAQQINTQVRLHIWLLTGLTTSWETFNDFWKENQKTLSFVLITATASASCWAVRVLVIENIITRITTQSPCLSDRQHLPFISMPQLPGVDRAKCVSLPMGSIVGSRRGPQGDVHGSRASWSVDCGMDRATPTKPRTRVEHVATFTAPGNWQTQLIFTHTRRDVGQLSLPKAITLQFKRVNKKLQSC